MTAGNQNQHKRLSAAAFVHKYRKALLAGIAALAVIGSTLATSVASDLASAATVYCTTGPTSGDVATGTGFSAAGITGATWTEFVANMAAAGYTVSYTTSTPSVGGTSAPTSGGIAFKGTTFTNPGFDFTNSANYWVVNYSYQTPSGANYFQHYDGWNGGVFYPADTPWSATGTTGGYDDEAVSGQWGFNGHTLIVKYSDGTTATIPYGITNSVYPYNSYFVAKQAAFAALFTSGKTVTDVNIGQVDYWGVMGRATVLSVSGSLQSQIKVEGPTSVSTVTYTNSSNSAQTANLTPCNGPIARNDLVGGSVALLATSVPSASNDQSCDSGTSSWRVVSGSAVNATVSPSNSSDGLFSITPAAAGSWTFTYEIYCDGTATGKTATVSGTATAGVLPIITTPEDSTFTADSTPTIAGTGQPGATITVTDGATIVCMAVVAANGSWTCDATSPLAEGTHELTATETLGGSTIGSDSTLLIIDTSAPAAPTVSSPTNGSVTNDTTPTITGTGEPSATITVKEGANVLCTALVDGAGNWSCDSTTLATGSHTLTVTQADLAGNVSAAASVTFSIDTTAPSLPAILGPTAGAVISDATPTISGTGEPGATITVTDGSTVLCTAVVAADATWSCTSSTLTDGVHTISATQTDAAGNTSGSATQAFTVDTAAPSAPVITSPTNGLATSDTTPTVSGTGEPGATVQVKEGSTVLCAAIVDASGAWSCDSTVLTNGNHTITAVQTDPAGNTSAAGTVTFAIDTVAPSAPAITSPAAGSTIGDTSPTITGTGEAGATVTVREGSTVLCTAVVAADGTWSCDSTVLTDGSHTVTATQTDPAGNVSGASTRTFTVDSTVPVAPVIIVPAAGAVTNDSTPTIGGVGEPGATVTVKEGSTVLCTAVVAADGTWSCASSTLTDGAHTVSVTQTDTAGNVSVPSTRSFTVDTVAPGAPVIVNPVAGSSTNDTTPTITGTGEPGATVKVREGSVLLCTSVVAVDGTWSCVSSTLTDGLHTVSATQTDPAGNESTSVTRAFTVDTIAPKAPSITSPADSSVTGDNTPTISGTGEPGATVTVVDGATVLCTAVVAMDGTWSCVSSTLTDGSHTLTATQTDAAGNTSTTDQITLNVDTGAPAAAVITSPADSSVTGDSTPVVRGTGEPGATVTVSDGSTVLCTATVAADGTWSCVSTTLTDGSHTITATQTDVAGNTSAPSAPVKFTVDTAAPAAPVITAPTDGATTADTSPTVSGTGEPGATVTVKEGTTVLCTAVVGADGNWSCDSATLTNGSHTLTVTETDAGGNVSPSDTVTFTVDSIAPKVPTITSPTSGGSTSDTTPTISGTGEPGSTITVTDGSTVLCTATVAADGTWSCTAPTLSEGAHTITATSTDAAGNTSTSAPLTFNVDTTAPVAPVITAPTDAAVTTDTTPTVMGTGEPGATITVAEGSTTLCTATVTLAGTWSCTSTTLTDGNHTLTVTQTDTAGNVSPADTVSFSVDTKAPAAPSIATPAAGTATNDSTPTISGSGEPGSVVTVTEGGVVLCTATVNASGTWSCTSTTLTDGPHTISATQTDTGGNVSATSFRSFVVDTVAPAAPVVTSPTAGSSTNDPTPTVTGTGEPGATITVSVDGNVVCTATVAADGTWSCTSSTLTTGTHTLSVLQTDAAGNVSPTTTVTFAVDTIAPTAPVVATPAEGSSTADTTPTVSGTGEPGDTVTVTEGTTVLCTATVTATGTWSCDTPVLPDGEHTLSVTQTDPAGNVSPVETQTFTTDSAAPTAPTVTSPTSGSATGDSTPTITGTGEPGATVTVAVDGNTVCTAVVAANGTWSCTSTTLPDGSHTITATQTDAAGNVSPPVSTTFTVDTVAPTAPVVTSPTAGTTTADSTPTVTGTGEPGATVTVSVDGDTVCTATVAANGTWSCVTDELGEGTQTLTVVQTDPSGNTSTPTTVTFTVDTTAPVAPVVTSPAPGTTTVDTTPTITGTGEAGSTVTVVDGSTTVCTAVVAADGSWSCTPTTPLPDGGHTLTVTQTDPSGNESPATTIGVTIDTTAPIAPVVTAPTSGSVTNDSTPTFTGTGEPGATVTVTDGSSTVCTATVDSHGAWSCTPTTPLTDGVHTVTVTQTDPMGNVSPATTVTVGVDTKAPVAPTVTSPTTSGPVTTPTTTVAGTGEPGTTITVTDEHGGSVCTTTVNASGDWSCSATTLPNGSHELTVVSTDSAGNTSPKTKITYEVQQVGATVSGRVFVDANADSLADALESDLAGVDVELVSAGKDGTLGTTDDVVLATATTHSPFQFQNVADGQYLVRVVSATVPKGYTTSMPTSLTLTVTKGAANTVLDFGYMLTVALSETTNRTPLATLAFTGGNAVAMAFGGVLLALCGFFILAARRREEEEAEAV